MNLAHEGHVIIKKSGLDGRKINPARFFRPIDKGSAKPAFCYPRRREALKDEVDRMQRILEGGHITADKRMAFEIKLNERKERLEEIQASFDQAKDVIGENKDEWVKYRKALAEEITERMPTMKDERLGRVNPYRRLKEQKEGGLEALTRQYQIVSKALDKESNVSFLQKEK